MKKKNLKNRIKRVISLSILMSILFFTLILSIASAKLEKDQGYLLASMVSNMTAKQVFSPEVLDTLNLDSFLNFNSQSYYTAHIINKISDIENKTLRSFVVPKNVGRALVAPANLGPDFFDKHKGLRHLEFINGDFKIGQIAQIKLTIGDQEIYKSEFWGNSIYLEESRGKLSYPFIKLLTAFFKVESVYHVAHSVGRALPGAEGTPYATITVRLDPGFLVQHYSFVLYGILVSAIIAIIISNIIAKLLSRSVSSPFSVLEKKLKALANEDYETTLHSQIIVKKRALNEIQSIANSTNTIIFKMQQFNGMQVNQKTLLENQKNELEAQKEELLESRHMMQEAQSQLVQSQNLASIGQLTAAISHEINDPLDNIKVSVEKQNEFVEQLMSHKRIQDNAELRDFVNQLKEAGALNLTAFNRISSIIGSLKNFSRLDQSEMEEACINENVRSVVLLTSNLWKRRIAMHEDYEMDQPVYCYPGLINQVFMNIVVNAIHAIPDKGEIFIKTWRSDGFAHISVRDTGTGIPDNIMPHIFENGFTTKKSGKGSGLGLSICKSIVSKHNGKIDVYSKVGEGTEFVITIPIRRAA